MIADDESLYFFFKNLGFKQNKIVILFIFKSFAFEKKMYSFY